MLMPRHSLVSKSLFAPDEKRACRMSTRSDVHNWQRDSYLCSSDPANLQFNAIRDAFNSDMMWWAKGLDDASIKKMLDNCFVLGLYSVQHDAGGNEAHSCYTFSILVANKERRTQTSDSDRHGKADYRPSNIWVPDRCLRPAGAPGPRPWVLDDEVHRRGAEDMAHPARLLAHVERSQGYQAL
jgi:hypothetical protein